MTDSVTPFVYSTSTTAIAVIEDLSAPELSFEDACVEGKRLVEEMNAKDDSVQWRLGELADLIEPKYGAKTLSKFAHRIGRAPCTVKRYRTVYRAWKDFLPKNAPGLRFPYSVARELAGIVDRESRESLIERMPTMTKSQAATFRKAHQNPESETEEIDRWWKDSIKRANKDLGDEKYLDVDRHILRRVVKQGLLKTLRNGGEARIRLADGLQKILDEASRDTVA
jgi:hypothetical protein